MFPEFNQIKGKVQGAKRDFEKQLRFWKFLRFGGQHSKETGQTRGKICLKIDVSRIIPNPGMSSRQQHRLRKLTSLFKKLVVWGNDQQKQRGTCGQNLNGNLCFQNSTKLIKNYNSTTEILKITLVIENTGGFGVNTGEKQGKLGAKFAWKFMCELYQIQGSEQGTNIEYKN